MSEAGQPDLAERYYQSLYRFALSLARCEAVAADLTQETYYIFAAKGHQLRDETKVKSWLFTTLHGNSSAVSATPIAFRITRPARSNTNCQSSRPPWSTTSTPSR